ncbi:Oxysterol-binding protein-related protein 1 [Sarcoptes scabiei]|nr:Oxysterol-binding protein-related protein 1 [Sarcoptes scabiei]
MKNCDNQSMNESLHSQTSIDSISRSIIPSIKFHLNLILESSKNANISLQQCLVLASHQNESRQMQIKQEEEKCRFLEEALQVLAREHYDLERSISKTIQQQQSNNSSSTIISPLSSTIVAANEMKFEGDLRSHNPNLTRSFACLSITSGTDIDEYYDAFDDEFEIEGPQNPTDLIDFDGRISNVNDFDENNQPCQSTNETIGNQLIANTANSVDESRKKTLTEFYTADENENDATINESISTLSPDDDANQNEELADRTIISESEEPLFRRDRLPAPMVPRDEVGLWSILKHCIGKELSKITFPVIFNEPLSFLQRMTEIFQYSHYLNVADQCDDIIERMENVCAFIVSAYSSNWLRLNKPFNPLLGETFQFEIPNSQTKIVFEQVSHHPPISAWHAESPHFILHGTSAPKLRFWGKSIEVKPDGFITLELKSRKEIYTWKSINCCVHNIIVGKLWFEQYGIIEVVNHSNQFKIVLNFKPAGWFGYDLNRFDGFIQNRSGERLKFLYGKWNDYLKSANIDDYQEYLRTNNNRFQIPDKPSSTTSCPIGNDQDQSASVTAKKMFSKLNSITRQLSKTSSLISNSIGFDSNNENEPLDVVNSQTTNTVDEKRCSSNSNRISDYDSHPESSSIINGNGDIPKSDSTHSLDINNSRILWKATPRPAHSSEYYHFNGFTFGLNELPPSSIVSSTTPTSSNANEMLSNLPRTDSRFRPDIRKLEQGDIDAAAAEKNRLEEKQREARRLQKKGKIKEFQPLWFRWETNPHTGQKDWLFTGEYWRQPSDWSNCLDIF